MKTPRKPADLFPFECHAAVELHAAELHRLLRDRVDPRAETVRIVKSRKVA